MEQRMHKVKQVCQELFDERKYTILEIGEGEQTGWYMKGITSKKKSIHLYLTAYNKLNVDMIKFMYSILMAEQVKQAILVYQQTVTSSVHKLIETLDIKIELFHIDELSYNLLKHKWVPRHEKVDFRKKNDLKYPILKKTDPVAKFMGFKTGDVIRIHRNDQSIYYRYVK